MNTPENNQHLKVLIWVGGGGSENEYALYEYMNVDNRELPLNDDSYILFMYIIIMLFFF